MTPEQKKQYVETFPLNPGGQGYTRVLIQLFGYLGHGKSAFVNSCKFVMEGQWALHADQRQSETTITKIRRSYRLTDVIYLVDNRGLSTANYHETGLLYAQLGNLAPLDERIVWPRNYTEIMTWVENSDLDPNYTDIIVPVYLHSVTDTIVNVRELKTILDNAETLTGIKPFVVLTRASQGKVVDMRNIFINMGIHYISQLENYTPESHTKVRATHEEILSFLYEVLKEVETYMETPRNPREERVRRRTFILNFTHKEELEEEKERARRQAADQAARKRPCLLL